MKPRTSLNMMVISRCFAAEHELLRRLRELLDQSGREILAESRADAPAVRLLAHIADEYEREINEQAGQQRKGEIDQQSPVVKKYQDRPIDGSADQGAERSKQRRAQALAQAR